MGQPTTVFLTVIIYLVVYKGWFKVALRRWLGGFPNPSPQTLEGSESPDGQEQAQASQSQELFWALAHCQGCKAANKHGRAFGNS